MKCQVHTSACAPLSSTVRGPLQEIEMKIAAAVVILLGTMGLPLHAADGQAPR
jgi:hypothetical protein